MLPPFIGLTFLLAVNIVFLTDIELTIKRNASLQNTDEAEWGFGQILAMLLLFMPLRDLAETVLARRITQRRQDLDLGLKGAIVSKDWNTVLALISRGADPNAKLEGDITAIQMACDSDIGADVLKAMLIAGADPNIQRGQTRDASTVDRDNKACLHILNQFETHTLDGGQALIEVAKKGYGVALKVLCAEPRVNVNTPVTTDRETILIWTAAFGQNADVKLLLATSKFDINATDNQGRTALISAASRGQRREAVIELLLATHGIDINAKDKQGRTALHLAAGQGREATVELFLAAPGIDVNAPDVDGRRPLHAAAFMGGDAVVKLLLAAPGIDINAADATGRTPLHSAVHETTIHVLLAGAGVDVNAADADGLTVLMSVAISGEEDGAKDLLAAPGIDINACDADGWTALDWATLRGEEAIVRLLCARPGIVVDVAASKRRVEDPPEGKKDWQRGSGYGLGGCLRVLEEFELTHGRGPLAGSLAE
ncbi:ankyrin repeat-containing domain protein [Ephemerocybe angulata]|uniref:Ankyrin repeat-containing domain protein n=1 Tax=Ephemerocybe angulata TaxID=980116 RepID=A0A8H6HQJ9_9AGAR|nr:ankyrin repeat-containing domain protein [Tulosesus angulatus]